MGKIETITVEDAAKILGKSAQYIRYGLRQGRLPFGTAVEGKKGCWSYHIVKKKFDEYVGNPDTNLNSEPVLKQEIKTLISRLQRWLEVEELKEHEQTR